MAARKRSASMPGDLPTIFDPFTDEVRVLGTIPSPKRLVNAVPTWSAAAGNELIPESEWKDHVFDEWPAPIGILDQDGKGACNPHAGVLGLMIDRYNSGQRHVDLSPWKVYAALCGGRDVGSNILECLDYLTNTGTCTTGEFPYGVIDPRKIDAGDQATSRRFRIERGRRLETFEEIVTNVILRRPINFSLCVGARFNNIDAEGVPGVGRGPGNHAVTAYGGLKISKKWGALFKMPNSWSRAWGVDGFCWIARAHVEGGSWFEAYEITASLVDPEDPNTPPIAKA